MASSEVSHALSSRQARLFHGTGLCPFRHYCDSQSILSRGRLLETASDCADFYTDELDLERDILHRTFGNLADFSYLFWKDVPVPPNVYGAILLVSQLSIWQVTNDICVSTKPAVDPTFGCPKDCLDAAAVGALFKPGSSIPDADIFTEVSLGVPELPFSHVGYVVVDPIDGLFEEVVERSCAAGFTKQQVLHRTLPGGEPLPTETVARFQILVEWSRSLEGRQLPSDRLPAEAPHPLENWVRTLGVGPKRTLSKWLEYTYLDTLAAL